VVRARRANPDPQSPVAEALFSKLVVACFHPTLVFDRTETARRRDAARRAVPPFADEVRTGEKIVGAHEVVGRDEFAKMRALRDALQGRGGTTLRVSRVVGSIAFDALVLALFGLTLMLFRPAVYQSLRSMALIGLTFLIVIGVAALIARADPLRPELIPVALAAILIAVLFDPRIALVAGMVLAVLIGWQNAYRGTNALFLCLIGGVAAAFSVRVVRRRNQAYYSIIACAAASLLGASALGLMLGWTVRDIVASAGWGALSAALSVSLAMVLLPTAEELAGLDTYLKLLEWSDLNRPLMQQLSREAPGTYHHTMVMANLAEAACTAIGANGLLARVGAYYHDIGKIKKPQYFVENQASGRNPHDKLKPATSASIIRGHIKDGLELADAYRLPKTLRAFITEHHGTSQISFFLDKARERDGPPANLAEFQYPGPMPRTVETAVCMLADGVEAATRVLSDPSPQKVRDVIEHIVRQRIAQGQLRDAPITLRQLEVVKEQFARVLIGAYHNRIDYPSSSGGITSEFASA
jgi:putative nucleotidyltransferase with HDIG domain